MGREQIAQLVHIRQVYLMTRCKGLLFSIRQCFSQSLLHFLVFLRASRRLRRAILVSYKFSPQPLYQKETTTPKGDDGSACGFAKKPHAG